MQLFLFYECEKACLIKPSGKRETERSAESLDAIEILAPQAVSTFSDDVTMGRRNFLKQQNAMQVSLIERYFVA
jgi:hypothetical protein